MKKIGFEILKQDNETNARCGRLNAAHGTVETPNFVPVGTQATVKSLTSQDLNLLSVPIIIANTYHLHLRPGEDIINQHGGLHRFMGWNGVIMTDSGGFQIFSLGAGIEHGVGKIGSIFPEESDRGKHLTNNKNTSSFVKINEKGVQFRSHIDGSSQWLTPESSVEIQHKLGSDIILVLDECTSPLHTYAYTKRALSRTHRWCIRSLKHFRELNSNQAIYGIVQGGAYQDLREESSRFINKVDFDGIAIGGSLGKSKQDMYKVLDWTTPQLTPRYPRHLLGVGEVMDIFDIIERGVDTFDCVTPTRYGRYGTALVKGYRKFRLDVTKEPCRNDQSPIDSNCGCLTCQTHTRAYLHHLFHSKELLGYHLLTVHNIHFMIQLLNQIRQAILDNKFLKLKSEWMDESIKT